MEREKNILILTSIGGFLQKFEMNDVAILQSYGWKVHYASNFDYPVYKCDIDELKEKGIQCHHISIKKSPVYLISNFKALKQVLNIVHFQHISAIHCHNPMGGVIGRLSKVFVKSLYVMYTAHGFHFYRGAPLKNWLIYYPVEKLLARYTDQFITINNEDAVIARKIVDEKVASVVRIPGTGVDTEKFWAIKKKSNHIRKKYGMDSNTFFVLSVGELNSNKNHATVIRAISKIKDKEMNGSIKYLICGEGKQRKKLEKLIEKENLEEDVILCGYQSEILDYYQAADCFVFPSYREGFGMAAIEAMACGLPLIVSDNRGTREYAIRNVNAFICKADDENSFSKAIMRLWNDEKLREKMGIMSLHNVKNYDLKNTDKIMKKAYKKMEKDLWEQKHNR